jgi:hypothetical protein
VEFRWEEDLPFPSVGLVIMVSGDATHRDLPDPFSGA